MQLKCGGVAACEGKEKLQEQHMQLSAALLSSILIEQLLISHIMLPINCFCRRYAASQCLVSARQRSARRTRLDCKLLIKE